MTKLLTIEEVSEVTRVPVSTLRYYRSVGGLGPKGFRLGRRVVYKAESVDVWIDEQSAKGAAAH